MVNFYRYRHCLSLLLCMTALLVAPWCEAANPEITAACKIADTLRQPDTLDIAIAEYKAILQKFSGKPATDYECVVVGLSKSYQLKCAAADEYLQNGLLAEAVKTYTAIPAPQPDCVQHGLNSAAQIYVTLGQDLEKKSRLVEAKAAYEEAIKILGEASHAKLSKLRVEREITRSKIDALLKVGKEDAAKQVFEEEVKRDPGVFDEVASRIDYVYRPTIPFWRELRDVEVKDVFALAGKLPASLATLSLSEAILLFVVVCLLWRKFIWWSSVLQIKDFTADDNSGIKGGDFASLLQHSFIDITNPSGVEQKVTMVTGQITPLSIDANLVGQLPEGLQKYLQLVIRLIGYILDRPVITVSGKVHTKDGKKAITVELHSGLQLMGKHVIRAEEFKLDQAATGSDESEVWECLANCVATWVVFMYQQRPVTLIPKLIFPVKRLLDMHPTLLGTRSWESYAWFLIGEKFTQNSNDPGAAMSYLKSLDIDPEFSASRVNLARIYHHTSQKPYYELNEALKLLEPVRPKRSDFILGSTDPSLYTAYFLRAAIHFDLSDPSRTKDPAEQKYHLEQAYQNSQILDNWIHKIFWIRGATNPDLRRYLRRRKPIVRCMSIGIETDKINNPDNSQVLKFDKLLKEVTAILESKLDYYSLYNLACTYALFHDAWLQNNAAARTEYIEKSVAYLRRGFEITKQLENVSTVHKRAEGAEADYSFHRIKNEQSYTKLIQEYTQTGSKTDAQDDKAGKKSIFSALFSKF